MLRRFAQLIKISLLDFLMVMVLYLYDSYLSHLSESFLSYYSYILVLDIALLFADKSFFIFVFTSTIFTLTSTEIGLDFISLNATHRNTSYIKCPT